MDQTQLQQQIALYYSRLPADAQAVFSSMKWMDTLKSISVRYGLRDDQIETLGLETTLLLLGIIHIQEYEGVLKNELRIPETSAMKMLDEIDTEILRSIRASLGTAYDNHVKTLVEEKYGSVGKLDERFAKLPKSVQSAISESNYQESLYGIANKNKLSIEQMGVLEEITVKVLLGVIHPDQYESELTSKIELEKDKVTEIVMDVNEKILKTIREILKKHWSENESGVVNPDDEVPIPPYAISTPPEPEIKKEEVAKIEINNPWEKNRESTLGMNPPEKTETGIYQKAGIEIVDGMEMIGDKLKGVTISKNVITNHSLPKVGGQTPPQAPQAPTTTTPTTKAHDPYHEVIE